MELRTLLFMIASFLTFGVSNAQFGFFDQMFGGSGGGHQQQQQQNVRSDSQWYQSQYEGGEYSPSAHFLIFIPLAFAL